MTRVSSTMVNAIPFPWLKGWHAPAGRRTCEPRPLAQDGQIRPARRRVTEHLGPAGAPAGARKPGPGGRIVSRPAREGTSADPEVRPDPGSRPYVRTTAKPRKQGRKLYPHPPCRLCTGQATETYEFGDDQICQFCRGLLRG